MGTVENRVGYLVQREKESYWELYKDCQEKGDSCLNIGFLLGSVVQEHVV